MTTKEAADRWQITQRQVQNHCKFDRIPGVVKIGKSYLIPIDAKRPLYGFYFESIKDTDQSNQNDAAFSQDTQKEEKVIR